MNKYAQIASDALSSSPVIAGKTKVTTDNVIMQYPNGVTVTAFDMLTGARGTAYAVFNIKEDPTVYFNGGTLLSKIAQKWTDAAGGDVAAASAGLTADGGCKIRLFKSKTKNNNPITSVEVLG